MKRGTVLGAGLAVTLVVAAALDPVDPDATVVALVRPGAAVSTADQADTPDQANPAVVPAAAPDVRGRAAWAELAPDRLGAFTPPAPPPPPVAEARVAPAVAPAPAPPPAFPYRWIGLLRDGGEPLLLLADEQRSFGARAGDVLDGRWRVDSVDDRRVVVTWLAGETPVSITSR